MSVTEILNSQDGAKHFSFEVLPPLKGAGTDRLFSTIEKFKDFDPAYINITTHHSEYVYRELDNGQYERLRVRRRPGTVAIAATIQKNFGIPVIPHIICSGATAEDIEYELIDLQFLEIENLLLLRGDKAKEDRMYTATPGGHAHTTDLIQQVNDFNRGFFVDGTKMKNPGQPFSFGVACYPEKHEEAPNLEMDIQYLKMKQDMGAEYAVTQLFYDNAKYFHCDLPLELAEEVVKCKTDEDAKQLGIEWSTEQCRQLYRAGIRNIHFYTVSAVDSVREVAKRLL